MGLGFKKNYEVLMTEVKDCSNILHVGSTADLGGERFQGQICNGCSLGSGGCWLHGSWDFGMKMTSILSFGIVWHTSSRWIF